MSIRPERVETLVEHLFRREAGRMVAVLTRVFGSGELDLAEEVVQDALMAALKRWPFAGVPDNPVAWLYTVARNSALDRLRRRQSWRAVSHEATVIAEAHLQQLPEVRFRGEIDDDQLRLIFVCCHPALKDEDRVALTLKTVCGFGVGEIARAFLLRETTLAQRLVRAKRQIRADGLRFEMPPPDELPVRLQAVLHVLYLTFNEGYSPSSGDQAIRADICAEAMRQAELVAGHPVAGLPEAQALAALLLLHGARLPGRVDAGGDLLLLQDQDRASWDDAMIARGMGHLRAAMSADRVTALHLEAGIAACHAAATTFAGTDWGAILGYYDQLLVLAPSPVRALNRIVALAMVEGPDRALSALDALTAEAALSGYYLLPATRAELYRMAGAHGKARGHWQAAMELAPAEPVRRQIAARLAGLPA